MTVVAAVTVARKATAIQMGFVARATIAMNAKAVAMHPHPTPMPLIPANAVTLEPSARQTPMKALLKFSGAKGTSKLLVSMLAASILTNIVLAARLYFPNARHQLQLMMIPAPQLTADDHIRGPIDATTTVIVYTNYQCPYCARLNADLTALETELGFRLVYRLYADQAQVLAFKAASAAKCAGDQGEFWKYGDQLFIKAKTLSEKDLPQIAEHLKLDVASFIQCITTEKYRDELLAAKQQAEDMLITATPTYFINGKRYVGAKPVAQLKKFIVSAATNT